MDDSPLARLPAELRNTIYELVLSSGDRTIIHGIRGRVWKPPALLHTSRQIRNEASGIYISATTFSVSSDHFSYIEWKLASWLSVLDPESRSCIRKIDLCPGHPWIKHSKKRLAESGLDMERVQFRFVTTW